VRWRIEQADAFREQVEHCTDAERVLLADAYQALLRYGPLPHPSFPLVIHRFRDPRAGDAYALVLPTSWSGIRCSATPSWSKQPTSSAASSGPTAQPDTWSHARHPHVAVLGQPRLARNSLRQKPLWFFWACSFRLTIATGSRSFRAGRDARPSPYRDQPRPS